MRKTMFCAAMLLLAACGNEPANEAVDRAEDAWIRLPAVEGRPGAGYLTLNGGAEGDVLLAIDSPEAATIELHESRMEGGAMTMAPVETIEVPAGERVTLAPRGLHAMIYGLSPDISAGDTISLNLRFDSGRDLQIAAVTVAAGAESPFAATAE